MSKLFKSIYQEIPFKRELFQFIRRFYIPSPGIYKHLFFKGSFKVKVDDSHSFKMNHYNTHGFPIEDELFWEGMHNKGRENKSLELWKKLAGISHVIFDVGANTGVFSLVAKCVNKEAEIYGFEPIERIYAKYESNCQINNYPIHCEKLALSNITGTSIIYDQPVENLYSATLNKTFAVQNHLVSSSKPVEIQTKRLDDYILEKGITKIDLMKVDVEMHEPEVLEGMGDYLVKFRPTLLIEVLSDDIARKLEVRLMNLEYLFYNIDEHSEPKKVEHLEKSGYYNFLICSKETAEYLNLPL
ncbi:MAG TPA: methyltransferase [Bacteroidetes bacterium]|nr:methyltransferase [Bacteroidota bacterium]